MADAEKNIVEFLDGDQIKLGIVLKQTASRTLVTDQHGKQHSLNSRQIIINHDRNVATSDFPEYSRAYLDSVQAVSDEIDTELLWESIEPKGLELKPDKAAEIYFGNTDIISRSAIFRAAILDSLRFKRKGIHISVRSDEQVDEQLHVQKKKAEKEDLSKDFVTWGDSIFEAGEEIPSGWKPEFLPLLNSLEQAISNPEYELDPWLRKLIQHHSGPFRSRSETIVRLLVAGGRLPEGSDPFILESGLPLEFSEAAEAEADSLKAFEPISTTQSPVKGLSFSIDDEDTREIDDAISIREEGENYLIGIHISDASAFIAVDSMLDLDASRKNTSIYLPHRQFRMFPPRLSCDLMSLKQGVTRPAVSCNILVSEEGEILEWNFTRSHLEVTENLSYTLADSLLDSKSSSGEKPEMSKSLRFLNLFAGELLKKRISNNAVVINRPELKITVKDEDIELSIINSDSPSRRIVSELMILYNRLAASLAAENTLPFIYRSQKQPEGEIPELPETGYDNFAAFKLFSMMEPGVLSLAPDKHFGLGIDCYAQVTSPIRRYSDLLNQRQLASIITGNPPRYSAESLTDSLGGIESTERAVRKLERKMNRLFILRYMMQEKRTEHELVVLQNAKNGYLVETVAEATRGILQVQEEPLPGSILKGRISKIDPESDILIFTA